MRAGVRRRFDAKLLTELPRSLRAACFKRACTPVDARRMGSPLHEHLGLHGWNCDSLRRCEGAAELELHDGHHHARMHELLASVPGLDGTGTLRAVAKAAFGDALARLLDSVHESERSAQAEAYYAWLGLGMVWLDTITSGELHAPTSHVARAWSRRVHARPTHVCTLTEGFLEAALAALTRRTAKVREVACAAAGAPRCRFTIEWHAEGASTPPRRLHARHQSRNTLSGDVEGLIRIGNDELAHVPVGMYVQAIADWLALAASRGAPVLALAIAKLDHVSAPEAATLTVV